MRKGCISQNECAGKNRLCDEKAIINLKAIPNCIDASCNSRLVGVAIAREIS